jgi:hypothetical protein
MTPEVKNLIAQHQYLSGQLDSERRKLTASTERERAICAAGRAVQFQLLLHMPCRAFFKFFNINREAAL